MDGWSWVGLEHEEASPRGVDDSFRNAFASDVRNALLHCRIENVLHFDDRTGFSWSSATSTLVLLLEASTMPPNTQQRVHVLGHTVVTIRRRPAKSSTSSPPTATSTPTCVLPLPWLTVLATDSRLCMQHTASIEAHSLLGLAASWPRRLPAQKS
jgi:hypothetical protein